MRRFVPFVLVFLVGAGVGHLAPARRAVADTGAVANVLAVSHMTAQGQLREYRLAVYRAARADGGGELTPTRDKPDGDEWIVTVNGIVYRCTPLD